MISVGIANTSLDLRWIQWYLVLPCRSLTVEDGEISMGV